MTEQDILLLALAPELDLKYETLYGYLNNDVTRRWPTHDLALRLFAKDEEQKVSVRRCLAPGARCLRGSFAIDLVGAATSFIITAFYRLRPCFCITC